MINYTFYIGHLIFEATLIFHGYCSVRRGGRRVLGELHFFKEARGKLQNVNEANLKSKLGALGM